MRLLRMVPTTLLFLLPVDTNSVLFTRSGIDLSGLFDTLLGFATQEFFLSMILSALLPLLEGLIENLLLNPFNELILLEVELKGELEG
jgi:hypothetical protein